MLVFLAQMCCMEGLKQEMEPGYFETGEEK